MFCFFLLCVLDVFIKNLKDGGRLRITACCVCDSSVLQHSLGTWRGPSTRARQFLRDECQLCVGESGTLKMVGLDAG